MKPSLVRASMTGLAFGLLLGALWLLYAAYTGAGLDCGKLELEECALMQDTAAEMAHNQLIAAIGMMIGSAGVFFYLRSPATPPTPTSR
jgi:hypothetical protein